MRSSVAVAVGGAAGASLRWFASDLVDGAPGDFPWATLMVNLIGCLLIGSAAVRLARDTIWWDGLVVGALGGLTTFSAFAVETRQLVDAGRPLAAVAYVAASVILGIAAVELVRALDR